jgi:hypothetical protein
MTTKPANGHAAADFLRDLGDAARRNPVSTALIGMGVLWLIAGSKPAVLGARSARRGDEPSSPTRRDAINGAASSQGRTQDRRSERGRRAVQQGDDDGERLASTAGSALQDASASTRARMTQFGSDMSGAAADMSARTADLFGAARHRLSDMMDEQPLLLGAIGAAIGAGIAVSLPATRIEGAYFGEAADEFKAKAAAFAGHQVERVQTVAEQPRAAAGDATG